MNKSKTTLLISIIVIFFVGIGSFGIWRYFASFYSVHINTVNNIGVEFYKVVSGKNQDVKNIKSSTLSLQNGNYCIKPSDTIYDNTPTCFTVASKDKTVNINPNYSTVHLAGLLSQELDQVNAVINLKYAAIIDNYIVATGQLYGLGQWYGTTLTTRTAPSDRGDVYRVILKKENNIWTVVAFPQIVLSKYDYPSVPFDVLSAVNKLVGIFP